MGHVERQGHSWQQLYNRRRFGIKPGLEGELALLQQLGNPHHHYAVVHVAGTNGKGSVCAITAGVLQAAGLKTGLFTSPHLVRFNERYRIDGQDIGDEELVDIVADVEAAAREAEREAGRELTFFECSAAIAFEYFRRQSVQAAVIEVGLGGRFDATNVVLPVATAITRISLEHTEYLGPDVASIAGEKAGIIKPGVPIVCGANDDEAARVISDTAARAGAPWVYAPDAVSVAVRKQDIHGQALHVEGSDASYGTVRLPLAGAHQVENLATAVALCECAFETLGIPLQPDVLRHGVARVRMPGRLTVLSEDPLTIVDGAHNPRAGEALAAALRRLLPGRKMGLVLGMASDKDAEAFVRAMRGCACDAWIVPLQNERSMEPERLCAAVRAVGMEPHRAEGLAGGLALARDWARAHDAGICIAGSLFLAGEALALAEQKDLELPGAR